jgi:hypothetical protein
MSGVYQSTSSLAHIRKLKSSSRPGCLSLAVSVVFSFATAKQSTRDPLYLVRFLQLPVCVIEAPSEILHTKQGIIMAAFSPCLQCVLTNDFEHEHVGHFFYVLLRTCLMLKYISCLRRPRQLRDSLRAEDGPLQDETLFVSHAKPLLQGPSVSLCAWSGRAQERHAARCAQRFTSPFRPRRHARRKHRIS